MITITNNCIVLKFLIKKNEILDLFILLPFFYCLTTLGEWQMQSDVIESPGPLSSRDSDSRKALEKISYK